MTVAIVNDNASNVAKDTGRLLTNAKALRKMAKRSSVDMRRLRPRTNQPVAIVPARKAFQ